MSSRTANAANDMTKALIARGSVLQQAMDKGMGSAAMQIQLQDGTRWSLSVLDQMLASAAPSMGRAVSPTPLHPLSSSANLAHEQLISAMASFSPTAAGETSLLPTASEAYAIVLAANGH